MHPGLDGSDQRRPVHVNFPVFGRILISFSCGFRTLHLCGLLVSHCDGQFQKTIFPLSSCKNSAREQWFIPDSCGFAEDPLSINQGVRLKRKEPFFSTVTFYWHTGHTQRGLQGMTEMTPKPFCRVIRREILMIPFCSLKPHLNRKKQTCQYLERWFLLSAAVFYPGFLLDLHPSRAKSCLAVLAFVTLQLHGAVSVGEAGNTLALSPLSCWVLFQLFTDLGFAWNQHQCILLVVIYWVNCPQWLIQYIPERKYQNHSLRNTMGVGCVHSKCNWTEELIGFDKCWPIFLAQKEPAFLSPCSFCSSHARRPEQSCSSGSRGLSTHVFFL